MNRGYYRYLVTISFVSGICLLLFVLFSSLKTESERSKNAYTCPGIVQSADDVRRSGRRIDKTYRCVQHVIASGAQGNIEQKLGVYLDASNARRDCSTTVNSQVQGFCLNGIFRLKIHQSGYIGEYVYIVVCFLMVLATSYLLYRHIQQTKK